MRIFRGTPIRVKFATICLVSATVLSGVLATAASATPRTITTVAGNGVAALSGDEGPATSASLYHPQGVVAAPGGGYYVADNFNHVVRKVDPDGTIHRVAGNGTPGLSGDGGPATAAQLNYPRGLAVESDGSLLIADTNNSRIRRVAPDGTISTFAGTTSGFGGDGGPATSAQLCFPGDVAVGIGDNVLIADTCNQRVRLVEPSGTILTIAGNGDHGYAGDGGPPTAATLSQIQGIATTPDPGGYVIADSENNVVRRVGQGQITTVAGTGTAGFSGDGGPATAAQLSGPQGIEATSDGAILIPDTGNHRVRAVAPDGTITTLAGNGTSGFSGDGGPAGAAQLSQPYATTELADGDLLIADEGNNRIRRVEAPVIPGTTFVVNSDADTTDGTCSPLPATCTLREAIQAANGNADPGQTDKISFAIGVGGLHTITVGASPLPAITQSVTIDGATQPGYVEGGAPQIEVTGATHSGAGLDVQASVAIHALAINQFSTAIVLRSGAGSSSVDASYLGTTPDGLLAKPNDTGIDVFTPGNTIGPGNVISGNGTGVNLRGPDGNGNVVTGNRIGTDASGAQPIPNADLGVRVSGNGKDNVIGGPAPADRNIISGNGVATSSIQHGILIEGSHNSVRGNFIGVAADGATALANRADGIAITKDHNTIGPGNVISGNGIHGVLIVTDTADDNSVLGNEIGTNAAGTAAVPNGTHGVDISSAAGNTIGGTSAADRNVISGNGRADVAGGGNGIIIQGGSAGLNTVLGNYIGTTGDGTRALGNESNGVDLAAAGNTVGGSATGARNVISGNGGAGVRLDSGTNSVVGNYIGTNAGGTVPLGNAIGASIPSAGNTIDNNLVSGNTGDGLQIVGGGADSNSVRGNTIGADFSGTLGLGNGSSGIWIAGGADGNTIGGNVASSRNVIAGNGRAGDAIGGTGITVDGPGSDQSHDNAIAGNYIGIKANGRQPLSNEADGVRLYGSGNRVGGSGAGEGNVISGNGDTGVRLDAGSNTVLGNRIGTDATGTTAAGNNTAGVAVTSAGNTIGDGTTGGRNVISGNLNEGIWMSAASGNTIQGNFVGTDSSGGRALGNGTVGIFLLDSGDNLVGGASAGQGNVVSGNGKWGVDIFRAAAARNRVLGNRIGTDVTGEHALGNAFSGVLVQSAAQTTIGGSSPGERNVVSGNGENGIFAVGAAQTTVRGNYVGTDASGGEPLGNTDGIDVSSSDDAVVGGAGAGDGNVVGDNGFGIYVEGTSTRSTILGNSVGAGVGGADIGNHQDGILISAGDGTSHTIGGIAPGAGNTIAYNDGAGISVRPLAPRVSIRGNSIYANTDLGIDLGSAGRDANDNLDADSGPNGLQNYPELALATTSGGTTTVRGSLGSKAGQTYTIDFYSDTECHLSGNGEGRGYLGSTDVTTDSSGNTPIAATLPTEVPAGQVVTATATDADGNTSEFSACRTATGAPTASVGDTTVAEDGGSATVPVTLSGPSARTVTVDYATSAGTATAGSDYTSTSGTLAFAPGETSKTVSVPIVDDNLEESPPETFTVGLSNPHETGIGDNSGVVSIVDNDPPVFVVNSNADSNDGACTAAPGNCTLREAILAANASAVPARIDFQIGLAGAQTITVASSLPAITNPVTIDGQTQPGFVGPPLIELAAGPGVGIGLDVEASSTVRGLVVNGFYSHGILLGRGQSTIEGCYLGTALDGMTAKPNGDSGIVVGSPGNTIGGTAPAQRNVISGNGSKGIWVTDLNGQKASGNTILGNIVGLDASGNGRLANGSYGVLLQSAGNTLGGTGAGEGNTISGNGGIGVTLDGGSNTVLGNRIGTDSTGSRAVGNGSAGVAVTSGDNTIGDGTTAGRNVISASAHEGIWVAGATATGNRIRGNYVGTDATGTARLGNATDGITLLDAPDNAIGGVSAGDGNVVSANGREGVLILSSAATGNTVRGNLIGTDSTGRVKLGNGDHGVHVQSVSGATVGGTAPGARNVISGNATAGVAVVAAPNSSIVGNLIGTNVDGDAALGNEGGVYVSDSNDVTIGGADAGQGNVIDANSSGGVILDGSSTHATIAGNSIGAEHLGNGVAGVAVQSANGTSHTIGGTAPGAANTIAFNDGPGVQTSSSTVSVSVRRNSIYSNAGLGIDLKGDGLTGNDDLDADGLQNAPDLSAATAGGGQVAIRGELRSKPSRTYSVELFTERACDPSGHGQGRDYLGTVSVTTDSSGAGSFTQSAASSASVGDVVTATATDSDGNTSEFSGCQTVAAAPAVSAGDVTAGESDGNAIVPVTLSASSARTITVHYATADDSAQAGSDYESTSGTLTFAPGETSKDVHVPITGDSLDEPDEKFTLDLSDPVEATVDHGTGVVTIADDDAAPSLGIADNSVTEGTGGTTNATFAVTLSAPSGKTVTVDADTADGSATAPGDYSAEHVTLTFAPGETTKDVKVPIVADNASEPDETFQVALSSEADAGVTRREATGTIRNDDDVPGISVGDVRVVEGTGSAVDADFTVSLSRAGGSTTSVHVTTADGSAIAGSDYGAVDTTVTFAPGQTAKTVSVPVTGDAVDEPDETFTARLSDPVSGVIARGEATATIVDDDQPAPSAPQEQQPQEQQPQEQQPQSQPQEQQPQPQPQRDDVAPRLTLRVLSRTVSRATLLRKGLKLDITPNEPVSLDVQLLGRPRFLRGARSGDIVLARTKVALGSGKRTVKLGVLRKLRRQFTRHPAELRVSVLATDAAGNRTLAMTMVTVR